MPAIDVKDLTVGFQTYKKTKLVVEAVNFKLESGETLALVGESGSGKSMTALALMRLLPNFAAFAPNSRIALDDTALLELPEFLMRRVRGKKIAMIFQDPMSALNPVIRIDNQLKEALQDKVNSKKRAHQLVALLKLVEIEQPELCLQKYPHQLSGGQKQRVMIAIALAQQPQILIADEPTTALDSVTQVAILKLLKKLQIQLNMSLLLITHDLQVVMEHADRVCMMYAGQIVEESSVTHFFKEPKHPYTQQLMHSLPSKAKRKYQLPVVAGSLPQLTTSFIGCRFHNRCPYVFSACTTKTPSLQQLENSLVRCHLYPKIKNIPSSKVLTKPWPERQNPTYTTGNLLDVTNLHISYQTGQKLFQRGTRVQAVEGVSFSIKPGKTLALIGQSGCGKTTISRALLGLVPVSSGSIVFKNRELNQFSRRDWREYRKNVQLIMQDPFASMNPRLTIKQIIAEGLVSQSIPTSIITKKVAAIIDQVHLPQSSLERYPHQFSGGQRQRICIARALILEPELIICDEPTSALDISVQAQILNLLKELQIDLGVSYLFISHNIDVVDYLADTIIRMQKGRIIDAY